MKAIFTPTLKTLGGPLYLYLDDKNKGELPNLKTRLSPDNDTILQNALHLTLKSGCYKVKGKDNQGNVKFSGTTKFRTNSTSSSTKRGGQAVSMNDRTIVHKLFY